MRPFLRLVLNKVDFKSNVWILEPPTETGNQTLPVDASHAHAISLAHTLCAGWSPGAEKSPEHRDVAGAVRRET